MPYKRRARRLDPLVYRDLLHVLPQGFEDPLVILIFTSLFRDEIPWLYEIGREAYDSFHSRSRSRRERALAALRNAMELTSHSRIAHMLFSGSEEALMMFRETMAMMEQTIGRLREVSEEP